MNPTKYDEWFNNLLSSVGPWSWSENKTDAVLCNAQENKTVQFEQLTDFFLSIDAPHLRDGNIKVFFDAGFTTPEQIITMTEGEMCGLAGKVIGKKIFNGIRDKLTNISEYVLMGSHSSFGRGIGVRKMKKLWEAFSGDIKKITHDNILSVPGFDEKSAKKIINGLESYLKFKEIIKNYVSFLPFEPKKQGTLSGQTIVFTGFRDKNLQQSIEDVGGIIGNSVSSKTTILVTAEPNSTSTKAQKAKDLGIKVMGLEEFRQLILRDHE